MQITKSWITANSTRKGGFTLRQMALLNLSWPPPKGWISAVCGHEISDEDARKFELAKNATIAKIKVKT